MTPPPTPHGELELGHLRALARQLPFGAIGLVDRDLRLLMAVGRDLTAAGYPPEALEGRLLGDVLPADVRARIEPCLTAALRGEEHVVDAELGGRIWEVRTLPVRDGAGAVYAGLALAQDVTAERRERRAVERRLRHQAALAALGELAVAGGPTDALFNEAVATVAAALEVEAAGILELLPDARELLLGAGVGWEAGLVGRETVSAAPGSLGALALAGETPVVVRDVGADEGFRTPPLLRDRGAAAAVLAAVRVGDEPHGLVVVASDRPGRLLPEDVQFVDAVANVLAAAVQHARDVGRMQALAGELEQRVAERTAELEQANVLLREAEQRFRSAFENAPTGMALVSLEGRFLQVNRSFCEILGYEPAQLLQRTFLDVTHPDDVGMTALAVQRLAGGELDRYGAETRYLHRRGHAVWGHVSVSVVADDGERPRYFVAQVQDITERKLAESHLHYLADHDPLTNLWNRRRFSQELSLALAHAGRYADGGAVLVIDVDEFKHINDSHGHRIGDELLRHLAGVLDDRLRRSDLVARLGGDEFAVLLSRANADEARAVAQTLVEEIRRRPLVLGDLTVPVTVSIGVVLVDEQAGPAEELLTYADLAMFDAKRDGRDRVGFHDAP